MTANNDPKTTSSESDKTPEYLLSDAELRKAAKDIKEAFSIVAYRSILERNANATSSVLALLAIEDELRKRRKEQEKTDSRRPVRLVPKQPG